MNRFLVQFREHACDYFVTDCAFREGQIDRAILYVKTVVDTLDYVAEGQVLDAETKTCVYRYAPGEELVVAIFGKPEPFEVPMIRRSGTARSQGAGSSDGLAPFTLQQRR
jgi:hypothetical protein